MKKLTKEMFVKKAIAIHGIRYDYKHSNYKNYRTKVKITCNEHGDFEQTPNGHLNGGCCPLCSKTRLITTEKFVSRAMTVHGNIYDYSNSKCKSNLCKVEICCKIHGIFFQRLSDHLNGRGCPKCGGTAKSNTEEFICKSKSKHGNRYNYNKTDYISDCKKVSIICDKHGLFKQRPNDHLQGAGCPKCGGTAKLDTEEFILRSNIKHGQKYNYDKVTYNTAHDKVLIECNEHGFFLQKAYVHMSGSGCPICKESKGERKIRKKLTHRKDIFHQQYRFEGCRNKPPLPFDFAVETKKGLVLIEYQGEQHFSPVSFGGDADYNFSKTKINDSIKKDFCEKNGLQLVIINYCDDDSKIDFILESITN